MSDIVRSSPFEEIDVILKIALLPLELSDIHSAIQKKLNSKLYLYSFEMQAVPLMYAELEFDKNQESGRVIGEMPWIHINVGTKFTVFRPSIGCTIQGKINKVSDSHVSILAYGMFNASITAERLSESYHYNVENSEWESKHGHLKEGTIIEFIVDNFQYSQGVLFMEGGLCPC